MIIPESHFEKILANHGSVSASQISQGATSQNYIRQLLANKNETDKTFPRLIDGDFLSGSYARGTKIYPLDDIDVMLVMDGTGLYPIKNGQIWDAKVEGGGESDNPLLNQIGDNGLLSSIKVLDFFKNALEKSHPSSKVAKDGQAINVKLSSGIGIDVVPCFHIIPNNGDQDVYYIPTGFGSEQWTMTNPKIDEKISDTLHEKHNKKLKPVIKLLKIWNRNCNSDRLRSYHLETVAWYAFNNHPSNIGHYGLGFTYFLNNCYQLLSTACPDATMLGGPVDSYLTDENRALTLKKVVEAQNLLNPILLADEPRQFAAWRKIFGDQFGTN